MTAGVTAGSPAGAEGALVLHPRVAEKLAQIERLRQDLSILLEEFEDLLRHRREAVMALYMQEIGRLEFESFRVRAEVSELRYRIAFLQREVNLGEPVTAARVAVLDAAVAAEFAKTTAEIQRREKEVRDSENYLDGPGLPPEVVRELKSLYRSLCKKHHPDVNGSGAEPWRRWALLQHAYRVGDLDLMKTLAEGAGEPDGAEIAPPGDPDAEIARLQSRIADRKNRMAEALSSPPLSYEEKLSDPAWVRESQERLKRDIAAGEADRDRLTMLYKTLLPGSGAVH